VTAFQKGLTLVEVMVATVIFSLIMVGTVTALSTFAKTYKRLQTAVAATAEVREVERFLREALTDAMNQVGTFEGYEDSLRWVAPIDRVGGAGGLQQLQLTRKGDQLFISFAPMGLSAGAPVWGRFVPDFPLIDNVRRVAFSYQAHPLDEWQLSYSGSDQEDRAGIPYAVALEVQSNERVWPPLIVRFERYRERL
jgi:prepilin-type N-terminal cleavage/methylation domain-containing protein